MRYILILVFISYAFALDNSFSYRNPYASLLSANVPDVLLVRGEYDAAPEKEKENRSKREVALHPLDDPNDCLLNCTFDMQIRMMTLNSTDSDEQTTALFCKAVEPVDACYKACPESQFRTLLLDFLPVMRSPCLLGVDNYQELQKTLDCLNTTSDLIIEKCAPLCNHTNPDDENIERRVIVHMDPNFALYDDDKQENTRVFKSACEAIKCEKSCKDSIVKETCGQMASKVDQKLTANIFGGIMNIFQDLKALDGPIEECKSLF